MSLAPLRLALCALRQALRQSAVIDPAESFTVTLSYEAGHRFERWLTHHADALVFAEQNWRRAISDESATWHREVTLDGIHIRWPIILVAHEDGTIHPEPVSP